MRRIDMRLGRLASFECVVLFCVRVHGPCSTDWDARGKSRKEVEWVSEWASGTLEMRLCPLMPFFFLFAQCCVIAFLFSSLWLRERLQCQWERVFNSTYGKEHFWFYVLTALENLHQLELVFTYQENKLLWVNFVKSKLSPASFLMNNSH